MWNSNEKDVPTIGDSEKYRAKDEHSEKNARTVAETSLHLMKPIYPSQFL